MTRIDQTAFTNPRLGRLRYSVRMRIAAIAVLTLSLQIPIGMIGSTIAERRMHRDEATQDVTRSWGGRQVIRGPLLRVPYLRRWTEKVENKDGTVKTIVREATQSRYVLPETLSIEGRIDSEIRRRGIFDIPLYVARVALAGSIRLPQTADFPPDMVEVHWDRMTLVTGLSDPRSIREEASLEWNTQTAILESGVGAADLLSSGVHAVVAVDPSATTGAVVPFAIRLALAGSDTLQMLPAGSDTDVRITSRWPDPSFEGAYLPVERTVRADGFEAKWKVLRLARGFPQSWEAGALNVGQLDDALIGVRLLSSVDAYTTTERAVKYELLFTFLTFGALFLMEVLAQVRVHPLQYLLIGFALCLFYLLLLSLAEHVGFDVAYAAAAASIAALVTAYSRAVLGSRGRTAIIAALVTALYLYLFVLLQIQDYALLVGSAGLFVALAIVMFLTRRIDWYGLETAAAVPEALPEAVNP